MTQTLQRLIGAVVAIGVALSFCVFTVSENEVAIRTQFREIIQTGYEPGFHFNWPIDTVRNFEKRTVSHRLAGETSLPIVSVVSIITSILHALTPSSHPLVPRETNAYDDRVGRPSSGLPLRPWTW